MTKKFTITHKNGTARIFLSKDNADYICSVLYNDVSNSIKNTASTHKITEYGIEHFLAFSESKAIELAKQWIENRHGDITGCEEEI